MASNNDSIKKTLFVVIALSLVCSIIVSVAAVGLRDKQKTNVLLDKQTKILQVSGIDMSTGGIQELYAQAIEPKLVDFETGNFVDKTPEGLTAAQYDQRSATKDPSQPTKLAPQHLSSVLYTNCLKRDFLVILKKCCCVKKTLHKKRVDIKIGLDIASMALKKEFLAFYKKFKPTVILVTHDLSEAVHLSNRMIFLSANPTKKILDFENNNNQESNLKKIDEIKNHILETFPKILEGIV